LSNDPALELQKAIFAALTADAGVTAALGGAGKIFDSVPPGTVYPYVQVGDGSQSIDAGSHSSTGEQTTFMVHTWSSYDGRAQAMGIMGAISDRLHEGSLTISGQVFIYCRKEFSEILKDPDGVTHHGVQRFRVLTRRN
jgi:hypothetical protein